MKIPFEWIERLVGQPLPGGSFTIEHWENFLVHHVMEIEPLADGLAHPSFLFHAPIAGIGLDYAEIFALCHSEGDHAVRAGGLDWEIWKPLVEGQTYHMTGAFVGAQRKEGRRGGLMDIVDFGIDITDHATGKVAARSTNSWIFLRTDE